MITLYGKTYAASDRQAVDSLFTPGGTVNGFYRVHAGGVIFSDLQGKERAFIRRDGFGPVSIGKNHAGGRVYMFGLSSREEKWLGTPSSYLEEVNQARDLARDLFGKVTA